MLGLQELEAGAITNRALQGDPHVGDRQRMQDELAAGEIVLAGPIHLRNAGSLTLDPVPCRPGRVWDVDVDLTEEWIESKLPSQLPQELGGRFFVSSSDLVIRGVCGICADDASTHDATAPLQQ